MRLVREWLAKDITRRIGVRWGESFPFYYVSEFPKSGGTWVAKMVADYLQIPFPQYTVLPIGHSAVLQNHWNFDPRLRRVLYLYRDGRDVAVSLYFDRLRIMHHTDRPGKSRLAKIYRQRFGDSFTAENIRQLLPEFIEHEYQNPGRGARVSWRDHCMQWYEPGRTGVTYLTYEDLRENCQNALTAALANLTGEPVDSWRLATTVEKFSMERMSGRQHGTEDRTQHVRKGIVGDWKNHFTREAANVFHRLAGDALIRLGYEQDNSWVDQYDYVDAKP